MFFNLISIALDVANKSHLLEALFLLDDAIHPMTHDKPFESSFATWRPDSGYGASSIRVATPHQGWDPVVASV